MIQRSLEPFINHWILPGGYIANDESAEETIQRKLFLKTGIKKVFLEQLHVSSDPARDQRGRVINISFLSIGLHFTTSSFSEYGIVQRHPVKHLPKFIAFDHLEIIKKWYRALSDKLETSDIAQFFLPNHFTLTELQKVYEIILWYTMDTRNFRAWITRRWLVKQTGKLEQHVDHRPAKLYRFSSKWYKLKLQ